MLIHVVARGDTLWAIARRYGVGVDAIVAANAIQNPDVLVVGQALAIPPRSTAPPPPPPAPARYIVVAGDSLWSIAQRFGTTVAAIAAANNIVDPSRIDVGQVLLIPVAPPLPGSPPPSAPIRYVVVAGDSLWSIAQRFGTTVAAIAAANNIADPSRIDVGQVLIIPIAGESGRIVETNGYIFPLSETTLRRTLTPLAPYLTYISVFSSVVSESGKM